MLLPGYVKHLKTRLYWNPAEDVPRYWVTVCVWIDLKCHYVTYISIIMPILTVLDRIYKIRPVLDMKNEHCKNHERLE